MKRTNLTRLVICAAAFMLLAVATAPLHAAVGTMFVKNNNVGIYTDNPAFPLHIVKTAAGNAQLIRVVNNGAPFMVYEDTSNGSKWGLQPTSAGKFTITKLGVAGAQLLLDGSGNLTIQGKITTSGSCSVGCDRVFSPEYEVESIEEHAAAMWQNSYLPAVGPTPEGQPINVSDKTTAMLNELEKAHIYIEQLHNRLEALEAKLAE